MPVGGFPTVAFGPFTKGVIDGANSLLDLTGAARYIRNAYISGAGRLLARPGTQVALTLMDDQGTPAACTSVVALTAFGDGALAVGHSTVTQKFYLYWLNDSVDDWYDLSKVAGGTLEAAPIGVLWTGAASPEVVTIAEGLGLAYIAHYDAGTSYPTKLFDSLAGPPATLATFQADLDGTGAKDTYFRLVNSFQQHLWGAGFGSAATGDNDRPELLRFGLPFFAGMGAQDSFGVGHRVRSERERVVGMVVAGQALYVGTNYSLWPVTGFGRDSWDKSRPLDDSYGFAGPLAAVAARNGWLYYWSHRGPLRVLGMGEPEPLFARLPMASGQVVDPQAVVATFDPDRDQVIFLYRDQTSGRVSRLAAFDVLNEVWLGPDGDIGLGVACAALVQPTFASGPAGPPVDASTTMIGGSAAQANWTNGEAGPGTVSQIEYRRQGDVNWIVASTTIPAGQASYQLTGLQTVTDYEWRVKHIRNGQSSAYLGPSVETQFTTTSAVLPPSGVTLTYYTTGSR